jgi:cytidine deaminase
LSDRETFELGIIKDALMWKEKAYAPHSNIKVGAVAVAEDDEGNTHSFPTCNFEISKTIREHAEKQAIRTAWMMGMRKIKAIYVTSQTLEEDNYLCPECRAYIAKLKNPNIKIIVINPDGTIKGTKLFSELLPNWNEV